MKGVVYKNKTLLKCLKLDMILGQVIFQLPIVFPSSEKAITPKCRSNKKSITIVPLIVEMLTLKIAVPPLFSIMCQSGPVRTGSSFLFRAFRNRSDQRVHRV